MIPDFQKNESILSFEYKSKALLCIYSLGMLFLIRNFSLLLSSIHALQDTFFYAIYQNSKILSFFYPCEVETNNDSDAALIQDLYLEMIRYGIVQANISILIG